MKGQFYLGLGLGLGAGCAAARLLSGRKKSCGSMAEDMKRALEKAARKFG